MRATPIPARSREVVKSRERFRCARCQVPAPTGHWHHRRLRSVRDAHTHCACVGVWLCATCHAWAHAHPSDAREAGYLMSRFVNEPWTVPFKTPLGWRLPDCQGGWREAL